MNTFCTWSYLLTKRLLHKPLFLLTLALIPLFVLILHISIQPEDSMLQVALYTDSTNTASAESELLSQLTNRSQRSIRFYVCATLEELQDDVTQGKAACGYVIPSQLEEQLQQHERQNTPILTVYCPESTVSAALIDEIIYSSIYQELAYDIVSRHIYEKTKQMPDEQLRTLYQQYQQDDAFIQFEYADGTENRILNQENTNYMMLPVRGIAAVLILLSAMAGTVFWYDDQEHHVFLHLNGYRQSMVTLLYSFIPCILAGLVGFIAICLTGLRGPFPQECIAICLFLPAVCAYCLFARELLPTRAFYLAALPVSILGNLLLCPVFADLTSLLPILQPLRKLCPVYYYLRSIYTIQARWEMILYTIILLFLSLCLQKWRHRPSLYQC